jgi:hypothetical protein
MRPDYRTSILVAGGRDLAEHANEFKLRSLRLVACDFTDLTEASAPEFFAGAKALIVAEPAGKFGTLADVRDRIAPWAANEGVALTCFPQVQEDFKQAAAIIANLPSLRAREDGRGWISLHENIQGLAEILGRHNPGPGTGSADIVLFGDNFEMPNVHGKLLRRAFWDASRIAVEKLPGGASSPGAYRVYASIRTENGQQEPTPFVFKVDRPHKILEECNNYREFVQPSVPFHLRPGLIEARCIETPDWAALACNFVEGATPLETALSNGQGAGAIFSLFETTLRRFRHQAHSVTPKPELVSDYIRKRVKIAELRTDETKLQRIELAKLHKFEGEPEDLQEAIAVRADGMVSLYVVVHGDLHMGNVMVRHKDSIVVDFGSMLHEGPLTVDPAALEASIAFGTRKGESPNDQQEWFKFIDEIYQNPLELPIPTPDHFPFAWVNRAIREGRHIVHCCGVSPDETLLVLAASLLRYGRFSKSSLDNPTLLEVSEERKAYAMVKAQQLFDRVAKH